MTISLKARRDASAARSKTGAARTKMEDIARIAEVSVATVSRALAGSPRVTPETRTRIEAAVRQTGYVVNHAAQGLRLQRSRQLLVMLPTIANPFFAEIVQGIEDAAQEDGFGVLVGSTEGSPAREAVLARQLLTGAVDGLVLLTGRLPPLLDALPELGARVVAVSEHIARTGLTTVGIDNEAAAEAAVAHLTAIGHRRIAHIGGPAGNILTAQRAAGYAASLARVGIVPDPRISVAGDFTIATGEVAMRRLLAADPMPSAIFCDNDAMAMGAIKAIKASGRTVPRDISVMGFDDIGFAEVIDPPLTTVRQPRREFGRQAVQVLMGHEPRQIMVQLPFELIIRESTANPPAGVKDKSG